jgi:hypothetical protein
MLYSFNSWYAQNKKTYNEKRRDKHKAAVETNAEALGEGEED